MMGTGVYKMSQECINIAPILEVRKLRLTEVE